MNPPVAPAQSLVYYRLIALWVLCEAMLGSIIFSFKIPVSGLVIGSCAVLCIALIAWYVPVKGAIIRATVLVAIFKMMLSPQAPPAAYIAVFFQGLMGELLFWNRKYYRLCCVLLAIIAMIESAFQRILVISILYGSDFWTAVNKFLSKIMGSYGGTDFSFFIIFWYVALHIIMGILVGVWAGFLPDRIRQMKGLQKQYQIEITDTMGIRTSRRKRTKRLFLFITWVLLMSLYVQSFFRIGDPILPEQEALRILIRSIIIVLAWYFFISPALKQMLQKWLQQKKQQSGKQVQEVLNLLPATQGLVSKSWRLAGNRKGWKRIMLCCKIILANTFYTAET